MKTRLLILEIFGFALSATMAYVMAVAYDWSHQNVVMGLLTPINKSTWESLKLLFVPCVLIGLLEYVLIGRRFHNFIYYKAVSLLAGMALFISLYYIYSGIIGYSYEIIDKGLFLFSLFINYRTNYRLLRHNPTYNNLNMLGGIVIFLVSLLFIIFTFLPLPINLFAIPVI